MDYRLRTRSELEAYYGEDSIECLECGKHYRTLGTHIVRIHNMSVEEYQTKYGLPLTRGLVCRTVNKAMAASAKYRNEYGSLIPVTKRPDIVEKAHHSPRRKTKKKYRTHEKKENYSISALKKWNDSHAIPLEIADQFIEFIKQTGEGIYTASRSLDKAYHQIYDLSKNYPEIQKQLNEAYESYRVKRIAEVKKVYTATKSLQKTAIKLGIGRTTVRRIICKTGKWSENRFK